MKPQKSKTNLIYKILTGIFIFFMLGSAIPDVLMMQLAIDGFAGIGLPAVLVPFLGVAKTLGVFAIVVPGFPKLREWAYAGLIFDLIGAIYLIAMAGRPASDWAPVFLPLSIGLLSYRYYQKSLLQKSQEEIVVA